MICNLENLYYIMFCKTKNIFSKALQISRKDFIMNYINVTPHIVRLNNGEEFAPSGMVARVSSSYREVNPEMYRVEFGEIVGLPEPKDGTMYIVSGMVASATNRTDVVSPATGHPDVIRKDGQIYSVPGFIVK